MPTRTHVTSVAWPPKMTDPWLVSESTVPTNRAIGMHRVSDDLERTICNRRGGDGSSAGAPICISACCILTLGPRVDIPGHLARVLEIAALAVGGLHLGPEALERSA